MRTEAEKDEFFKAVEDVFNTGVKFKAVLMKKGLKYGITECPRCKTLTLRMRIVGNRNHAHMACDNACGMRMME
jgi:hypothetical protein